MKYLKLSYFLITIIVTTTAARPQLIHSIPKNSSLKPIWLDSTYYTQKVKASYPYIEFNKRDDSMMNWAPIAGFSGLNYRDDSNEPTWGYQTEVGVWLEAQKNNFYGWMDTRIYSMPLAYDNGDGQFYDLQSGEAGSYDYKSFGRFNGLVAFNTGAGDFYAGRNAQEWGPAKYSALVFNGQSIPFDHFYYDLTIGDFKVRSLWGTLDIREKSNLTDTTVDHSRQVFGHRYEWQPNEKFKIGISEQLVVYDYTAPQLVIPVYPLFIAKSYVPEDRNNGNLGIDIEWWYVEQSRMYFELLIDDMESPFSLFTKNLYQNKWGLVLGHEYTMAISKNHLSFLVEGVYVAPYVYSHFFSKTAQTAHGSMPLGLVDGPAYQRVLLDIGLMNPNFHVNLIPKIYRKGTNLGSDFKDNTPTVNRVLRNDPGYSAMKFEIENSIDIKLYKYLFAHFLIAITEFEIQQFEIGLSVTHF